MDKKTKTKSIKTNITAGVLVFFLIAVSGSAFAAERKLAFPVSGVIAQVMVKAGQAVKAGAPLARLDIRPLEAKKSAADARLKAAESRLKFARQNRDRVRQLFDDLSASGEQMEDAEIKFVNALSDSVRSKARADIAAWRLGKATLRAPANGTVTAVKGYTGMVIQPYAEITTVIILTTP